METVLLIIENAKDGTVWGRVSFDDNLITEEAGSVHELELKIKALLKDWHNVDPDEIDFDLQYDIAGLFGEKKFLNAAVIADLFSALPPTSLGSPTTIRDMRHQRPQIARASVARVRSTLL